MKRILFVLTIVLMSTITNAQKANEEQELKNLIGTLQKGWNSASGETFASAFAEPHDFIVWNGYYFKNNTVQSNTETHQWIFNTIYRDTQLFYAIDKIKFLKEDIALLHVFGAVAPKDELRPEDPEVLMTIIAEKKNGHWKIVSFHNLDLEVFQNEGMLKGAPVPPSAMYASWYAENSKQ
ncbi:SgcJ/EcaC family oxidoreductase [Aequorivita todarodis]|uniref:SgcJ/EcaC family oxidoreductase n=1 Tax=Aequorivita todarodis TaxID=2036821 RepID=UPI002350D397|nr:SgcJ/EcaC family oxidoreductase [Aequorivita todarodis]MDC8000577.1 SgcJ/EcaC family oxidoreductase [Aequorivita todarodis]